MTNVDFSWAARPASENVTEYRIYEDTPAGRVLLAAVPAPATTVRILVSQGTHKWLIAAVGNNGEGIISSPLTVNVFPPFGTPGIVSSFSAVPSGNP